MSRDIRRNRFSHGSDMREIGQVKAEYAPVGLNCPGWVPDGRRAFFFHRHGMYTVNAD